MTEPNSIVIPDDLILALRSAQAVTVLTGAGISAESGIPTFRDSQSGLWAQYDPHDLATPQAFEQNPNLVMDWYRWRKQLVSGAAPNPGHTALAQLERLIPRFTLVTQNVDGLHEQAGSRDIIELHGSLQRLRCSAAGCRFTTREWPVETELAHCPECGNLLRPDVVWFGEMLPQDALQAALDAAHHCDIFFSVGTSGVVEPAASLPYEALRAGAVVVEVNPQPTPLSIHSRYYFPLEAGQALPSIVDAFKDAALNDPKAS